VFISSSLVLYYRKQLVEYQHRIPAYMDLDGVKAMEEGRMTKATINTEFYNVTITKKD
jgi:hypothetical protein